MTRCRIPIGCICAFCIILASFSASSCVDCVLKFQQVYHVSCARKTYSGKYGDLAATFAAILLHSEARFPRSLSDGALREPLLKFLHIMRSLEYKDKQPNRLVVLDFLQD